MTRFRRNDSRGVSLIELTIGLGLGAGILIIAGQSLNLQRTARDGAGTKANIAGIFSVLGREIRTDYLYRTQLETDLGAGIYDGVEYNSATDPHTLKIRYRSQSDTNLISLNEYGTDCMSGKSDIKLPPLPSDFCKNTLPSCSKQLTIYRKFKKDETKGSYKMYYYPNVKTASGLLGSTMCILDADNEKVRLKFGFAYAKKDNSIEWLVQDFEVWEDTGMKTIEYLK